MFIKFLLIMFYLSYIRFILFSFYLGRKIVCPGKKYHFQPLLGNPLLFLFLIVFDYRLNHSESKMTNKTRVFFSTTMAFIPVTWTAAPQVVCTNPTWLIDRASRGSIIPHIWTTPCIHTMPITWIRPLITWWVVPFPMSAKGTRTPYTGRFSL